MSGISQQSTGTKNPAPTPGPTGKENDGVTFDDGTENPVDSGTSSDDNRMPGTPEGQSEGQPSGTPDDRSGSKPTESGTDDEINQDKVNSRINKLTFEKHEERRKREAAEKKAKELQDKYEKATTESSEVVIPPIPDTFDPQYEAKIKARDEAIAKKAEADAKAQLAVQQRQDQIKAQQEREQAEIQTAVDNMFKNGKDLGIEKEELLEADGKVATFIRDPSLAKFIISQENSALVVKYLASSAQELEKISTMDSISAAAYIATTIVPKADELKPGVTTTPDPLDIPSGKGGGDKQSPFLTGVEFE